MHGKAMPESFTKGQQIAQLQGKPLICFGPQHGFKKFGKSGQEICELFPHIGSVADDICIVRSMWTEQINHDPAHTIMNTGSIIPGRPSMGSWVFYGLGAEAKDLPGFVVLLSAGTRRPDAADRRAAMVGGAAAEQVSGREAQLDRRPGAVHPEPARRQREAAARIDRRDQRAEPRWSTPRCTIPRSRRASRSTRWRSRCRPACPAWWT